MGTRADFYVGRGADAEWIGLSPCECCEETEPCACEIGEATWHTGVVAPDGCRESTRGPVCFTHRREI